MSFEDWIFALHVLGAATLVGGLVMSWIVVVRVSFGRGRPGDAQPSPGGDGRSTAVVAGLVLAIGFGIWLAILRVAFPSMGWLGDRGDRPLGHRDGADIALVRGVREAGRRRPER